MTSAYRALNFTPEDPRFPLEAAQAIARDLHTLTTQQPFTLLIDNLDPDPALAAFLSHLTHAAPQIQSVFAGPEALPTHFDPQRFPLAPGRDKRGKEHLNPHILTSDQLVFFPDEARYLGLSSEAYTRSQGIPTLVRALLSPDPTSLFLRADLQAYVHDIDPVLLRAAFVEDDWTGPPPLTLLRALQLPDNYLADYQRRNWPFATQSHRHVPLLTELLRHALYTHGDVGRVLPGLARYYDAVDPIRAHALRNQHRAPFTLSPEALSSRRVQLQNWTANAQWRRIRDTLSTHIWEDARGLQLDLDAADTLLLVTAIRETAEHLEDLRFAMRLLTLAEGLFLLPEPDSSFLKADLLQKLGRLSQAQETYTALFVTLPRDHPRRTEVQAQLALCYLQAGQPLVAQAALGAHPTENPDLFFQVVLLQTRIMRGDPSTKTKQQAAALYDEQENWSQVAPDLQCRLVATLLDVGLLKPAQQLLQDLPADEHLSPWVVTERHRLLSVYALRQHQLAKAEQQAQHAIQAADQLSRYAHLPGRDYQDFLTRWHAHQWGLLIAIARQDHLVAEQHLTSLETIARLEGTLSREIQRCRVILNASQRATPQGQVDDSQLLGNDYSEITYVLRCCLGAPPVKGQPYPRAFDETWSTWYDKLFTVTKPSLNDAALPAHTLHLRMLSGAFTGQLGDQPFSLSVREAELLYVLATSGPQSSDVLGKQLFSFSKNARAYVNVTANNLGRRLLPHPHASEPLVALDPKTNEYRLHPEVQLTCDLHTLDQMPLVTLANLYQPFPLVAKSKRPQLLTPEFIRQQVTAYLAKAPRTRTNLEAIDRIGTLDPPLRRMLETHHRD
ncbi:hypothetical protein [Deinococcus sp. Leaf326]|uniref:hypothetical protein n=1 Tax=Deinococcus sp. Leaf326 TaxID=1736338 RepID=UPI0012E231AC|nr:hypothetical protein [Deinococcus sp. Leaf326]